MPEQLQIERELKAAFIHHLPERIITVNHDWSRLCQGEWDKTRLQELCQKIQSLTGTSGGFGLINLSESCFSLEVYLGKFIDSHSQPTTDQRKTVDTLMMALKHEAELVCSKSGVERSVNRLIYLLLSQDQLAPGLSGILAEQGCTVLDFNELDDVESEIQRRLPDVLLIDDSFLTKIATLNRELAIQQERQQRHVGVICISRTRDLEQRLLALRSGVDAYFLVPINIQDLTDRVMELASPKTDRYRILIVEDDASQADFAATILRKSGMKTQVITDPMKVIDALDEFRPDLILMDLYMPAANGIELTTIIREHPDFITTPVVFLSGEQDTDKQLQALSVGGDDFLSKPIRPRHLINTITNRVQRARILEKRHVHPSSRDLLTGLYNRRYFYEQLDRITTGTLDHTTRAGILYISLSQTDPALADSQNEGYLANMGNLISGLLEEQDIPARIDDRSIAILVMRPHQKPIIALAERLADKLQELREGHILTPYIGIATFGTEPISASDLLANASAASGDILGSSQHVKLYSDTLNPTEPPTADQLPLLFRQALNKRRFQLFFRTLVQPHRSHALAYDLKPRLRLPGSKQLGSSELLSLADEEGLGTQFSQWLIERALITLAEKRSEGKNSLIFIVQSSESIFQGTMIGWIRDQLRARQMVGAGLVFEYRIAELSVDLKTAKQHISQLQEMDIKVALSRFGANSAAIKVLHYLKADFVRLAGPILKAGPNEVPGIVEQIRENHAKLILPGVADPGIISPAWTESADLMPMLSAAPMP
ncbi:response regulator [Sedimenticola sp.]|uniref:response regulator n=1 Tax=Sedimenticola sp. TaxID=1940285 RepID=UPI003D09E633